MVDFFHLVNDLISWMLLENQSHSLERFILNEGLVAVKQLVVQDERYVGELDLLRLQMLQRMFVFEYKMLPQLELKILHMMSMLIMYDEVVELPQMLSS